VLHYPHDGLEMDDRTGELAEVIEGALEEIGGGSPLYRMMADHAARAVIFWVDYQLQAREGPTPVTQEPGPMPSELVL
jgi:hypothetical protein